MMRALLMIPQDLSVQDITFAHLGRPIVQLKIIKIHLLIYNENIFDFHIVEDARIILTLNIKLVKASLVILQDLSQFKILQVYLLEDL